MKKFVKRISERQIQLELDVVKFVWVVQSTQRGYV